MPDRTTAFASADRSETLHIGDNGAGADMLSALRIHTDAAVTIARHLERHVATHTGDPLDRDTIHAIAGELYDVLENAEQQHARLEHIAGRMFATTR